MSLLSKAANADSVVQFRLMAALLLLGVSEKTLEESVLNPYMDVNQLAAYLGCHPETVRRLTRDRKINGINVGGRWRYKLSEVEDSLRQWTDRRWYYYSDRRFEAQRAKQANKRRRAAGLETDEDSAEIM